jgi:hypothetical protein
MREKPGSPAHSQVSWEAGPNAGMRGWRRSADRARLQPNSLLYNREFYSENCIFWLPETAAKSQIAV